MKQSTWQMNRPQNPLLEYQKNKIAFRHKLYLLLLLLLVSSYLLDTSTDAHDIIRHIIIITYFWVF
jgi:hypothetical protein